MAKRNKNKNRKNRQYTNIQTSLDNYYWGAGVVYSHTVTSKEIHEVAQKIFGDTGYLTVEALTSE
jgi:hypothetical protein